MAGRGKKGHGDRFQRAVTVFEKHGGILRIAEALRAGIHPHTLYAMRDAGILERISRGVYRLAESPPLGNPDLVTVAKRVSGGVICLISALAFHDLTTQIPHEVHLALPRGAEEPRVDFPTIRTFRFTGKAFTEGNETPRGRPRGITIWNLSFISRHAAGNDTRMRLKRGLAIAKAPFFVLRNQRI